MSTSSATHPESRAATAAASASGVLAEGLERRLVVALCLGTDAVLLWAAYKLATLTRLHTLIYLDDIALLHQQQAIVVVLTLAAMAVVGAYNRSRIVDRFDSVYFAGIGILAVAGAGLVVATLLPAETLALSRRELVFGAALALPIFTIWRASLASIAARFRSLHRRFYVFGRPEEGRRVADELRRHHGLYTDAQFMTLEDAEAKASDPSLARRPVPLLDYEAIITSTRADHEEAARYLEFCEFTFGRTFMYPSLHDVLFFRKSKLTAIGGIPLIEVANRQFRTPYVYVKRAFDVAVAGLGLLAASPIAIATALAVKTTSPGPVFYTQERMGRNGRRFHIYKFRSMVNDAERRSGPMWAAANDARVTPVGRFIRKHRIDEIPQLWNVLRGDMSLIGPRPERPHFHEQFCAQWPLFARRLDVRPGVTSLSHVLGSYESDPEDRLRYDLMYINNVSLFLDLKILVATVRVVLGAKGAQ